MILHVVPKRRRITWRYNRVWRRDQKWTREEQTQQQKTPPNTPVTSDGPTKAPPVPEPKQKQTKQQKTPPTTQVTSDGPTKVPPVPEPKQPEPPQFLRTYWRTNRVWRRDMVWTRKSSVEPEAKTAVAEADPPSPTVETGLCEVQTDVTTRSSLGEDVPSRRSSSTDESYPTPPSDCGSTPHAEIPLNSSSDKPTAATDRKDII
ncbi:platelet glycoprotein Ib alpha chain-like [Saccostrea cucullata]|uniref:platelet glycoprotein Ib alpha chain-like n=1 Tax=Saccostrea cuccullata TaxID=36930 RepID=UPI002ED2D803